MKINTFLSEMVCALALAAGVCFLVDPVYAADSLPATTDFFDGTLASLKEGVARMTQDNKDLSEVNERLRGRLKRLSDQIEVLRREEKRLDPLSRETSSGVVPQAKGPVVDRQAAGFEAQRQALVLAQSSKDQLEADLLVRIKGLQQEIDQAKQLSGAAPVATAELARLTAEQEQLKSQMLVSQTAVLSARQELADLQGILLSGPQGLEAARKITARLEQDLRAAHEQEAALLAQTEADKAALAKLNAPGNNNRLRQNELERTVTLLDGRYRGLEQEFIRDERLAGRKQLEISRINDQERRKQELKLKDVSLKNAGLRAEMDQLRRRMVDLDRTKSALESQVYGKEKGR